MFDIPIIGESDQKEVTESGAAENPDEVMVLLKSDPRLDDILHWENREKAVTAHKDATEKILMVAESGSSIHVVTAQRRVHQIHFVRTDEKPPAGYASVWRPNFQKGHQVVTN